MVLMIQCLWLKTLGSFDWIYVYLLDWCSTQYSGIVHLCNGVQYCGGSKSYTSQEILTTIHILLGQISMSSGKLSWT